MDSKESQSKTSNEEEDCLFVMQIASASVLPMVLSAAVELNLLEIIAKVGAGNFISPPEIASLLPTQNPDAPVMIDRILRLLSSYSILNCSLVTEENGGGVRRLYGLAPVSKFLVNNEEEVSIAPFASLFQEKPFIESWYHLKQAVLEGGTPFEKAHGMNLFDYLGKEPVLNKVFNTAMYNATMITMKKVLETYKGFEGLKEVVDVGGGYGVTLNLIISKYPTIKGINFDLPHVVKGAPSYHGVEHIEGDMFVSVPKGEAIFVKWLLHVLNDEKCLKLLKNFWDALPDNGKVIAVEYVVPEDPKNNLQNHNIFQLDLIMLAQPGGKERTVKEFEALAQIVGFAGLRIVCQVYSYSVLEFYK
ncbi:caffeic acid 3-O-methyltransferase-like [Macadamia integrifolia]|uniref:caffeic acid 3-O-methyltransferase-like n=1 Tax=Macadamia integrifolia TaxID=60698 RepID=UPI001C4E3D48|nr:caffeic acid 3-O-methyltransferase-like [Macadamia integrifolia]